MGESTSDIRASPWLRLTFFALVQLKEAALVSWNSFQVRILEFPRTHPSQKPEALG